MTKHLVTDACQTFASESSVTGFYVAPFLKKFQRRESDQTRSCQDVFRTDSTDSPDHLPILLSISVFTY